jgi:hypothetical protein
VSVTNIGILDRVLRSLFDGLESVSIGINAGILKVAPPDLVPIDITGFLEILHVKGVKLLQTVGGKAANAVKGDVAIQSTGFVRTDYRVDSTYKCKLSGLVGW